MPIRHISISLICLCLFTLSPPRRAIACTMALPRVFENELEIEIEFEHYDASRDRLQYEVEIEVDLFPPNQQVQCQCALGLGSSVLPAPASFLVTDAAVGIRGDNDDDIDAFDGFERDSDVEGVVSELDGFLAGATAYGFSLDVEPFTVPPLTGENKMALVFAIEFDPDHFDQVNGAQIQFAAGSNEAGHELNVFQGYQPTLRLRRPAGLPAFGDFDRDGNVDGEDLDQVCSQVASLSHDDLYDLDGDGWVTENDVQLVMNELGVLVGDADLDGTVQFSDFLLLAQNFGEDGSFTRGDFDCSGSVEFPDFLALAQNFGSSAGTQSVPEPAGIYSVALGGVLLLLRRKERPNHSPMSKSQGAPPKKWIPLGGS